ncbi:zinc-binding alcohol dehydrogenase family protein [Thermogemmatispora sp.]|uniref:zinc-binding alcohol dehydrogenase family protein n=1 Tax=Thermogemmatispora sp. TaxID=1968838 RepID=UPI0035E42B3D
MRAVVTVAPQQMELVEEAAPIAGPGEALLRVEAVGLCGSDLHLYLGDHPYVTYPQVQGHEFCGTILAFGEGYSGPLRIGQRVAVEPLVPCGSCYPCRHGRPNCCTRLAVLGAHRRGALAELIAVRTTSLYPVGDLDAELAALVEPVSIGLHAVIRGQVTAEDRVVIFGAGPIGQAVLLAARERGAQVLVVDKLERRLALAHRLGAEVVINASHEDVAAAVLSWTDGDGPAVIFEATGVPAVIRQAVELVASAGRIVIIGLSNQEVSLPVVEFTRKELTVLGSRNNAGIFAQAVELVQRQRAAVRALISHRFPLEETPRALAFALEHPTEAEKVLILVGPAATGQALNQQA